MQTARQGGSWQTFLLGMMPPKSLLKAEALAERGEPGVKRCHSQNGGYEVMKRKDCLQNAR